MDSSPRPDWHSIPNRHSQTRPFNLWQLAYRSVEISTCDGRYRDWHGHRGVLAVLGRSAHETADPEQRTRWLEYRLSRISRAHVVDFQIHLDTMRRPIDTYLMWGAANQIMDGLCSSDAFWYFQPWLIGQGQHWYQHAARHPDNLVDIPAVRALAGRRPSEWANSEWPHWEDLAYIAGHIHDQMTGEEDSIDDALATRGHRRPSDPNPTGQPWNHDNLAEIQRRLPQLANLFPRQRHVKA